MKCIRTGRIIIWNKTTVSHGDQYACLECEISIIYSNSESYEWPGAFAQLSERALDNKAKGWYPDFPIDLQHDEELSKGSPEVIPPVRDLNILNEKQLKEILYETAPARVSMHDRFTEVEIVFLIDHPQFEDFSEEFRELIWVSISEIFVRELNRDSLS